MQQFEKFGKLGVVIFSSKASKAAEIVEAIKVTS